MSNGLASDGFSDYFGARGPTLKAVAVRVPLSLVTLPKLRFAYDAWKKKTYFPRWWVNGDLPWYKIKNHLKQTKKLVVCLKPFKIMVIKLDHFANDRGKNKECLKPPTRNI